jgi:uncharacterized protein YqeY
MPTKRELETELRQAMRQGDDLRKRTLRMALSAIKLDEVDRQRELSEEEILRILQKEAKSRQETIEDAERAGRPDLVESAQAEIEILEAHLPQPLSDIEIEALASAVIAETGASDISAMGKVMGILMSKTAGRADGQRVNAVVRQLLSPAED